MVPDTLSGALENCMAHFMVDAVGQIFLLTDQDYTVTLEMIVGFGQWAHGPLKLDGLAVANEFVKVVRATMAIKAWQDTEAEQRQLADMCSVLCHHKDLQITQHFKDWLEKHAVEEDLIVFMTAVGCAMKDEVAGPVWTYSQFPTQGIDARQDTFARQPCHVVVTQVMWMS